VCHRQPTGIWFDAWPTIEDYDEAIKDLQLAKKQLAPNGRNCEICEDSGHQAFECDHNPLLARKWLKATGVWDCWHCGYIATTSEEAKSHFGINEKEIVECLRSKE